MGSNAFESSQCAALYPGVEQVRRRHSHTLMVAVVSDLFVWCSVLCGCGGGGSGRKVHVMAYRTQKLSLRGSHRNSYCIWEEEFYK